MTRSPETSNFLVGVATKEYEALRKEVEARADVTKTYGWPVVLLGFGAIAGFKTDLISINAALTFVPAIVMTIIALDANANHDKLRVGRAIALVEDRVFLLSGAPVLCHESLKLFEAKKTADWQRLLLIIITTVAYLAIETWICFALLPTPNKRDMARTFLFLVVLAIPLIIYVYSAFLIYRLYQAPFSTRLLDHIKWCMTRNADEELLLYKTNYVSKARALDSRS